MTLLISVLAAYLTGSLNFGIILSKLIYKQDIRKLGSGDAGATNVLHSFGKGLASAVMICDAVKGMLAVILSRLVFKDADYGMYVVLLCAFTVIIGHMFPVYFGFKGGKGVATAIGAVILLEPMIAMMLVAVFSAVLLVSRTVSLGAVVAAVCYPFLTFIYLYFIGVQNGMSEYKLASVGFAAAVSLVIILRHRSNLKRIAGRSEDKLNLNKSV